MTSRDHARRILLILLAGEARGIAPDATDHQPLTSSSAPVDGGHASNGEWRTWHDAGGASAMPAAASALTGAA